MPPNPPLKLSDAEWTVMHALWSTAPASARDVLDRVGASTGWAYTTVKTMLVRLVEKGAVDAASEGNQVLYTPRVSRDQAQRSAVRTLVDRVFGGAVAPFVQQLLAEHELDTAARAQLQDLLAREQPSKPRRRSRGSQR